MPNAGYAISDVIVDGISVGALSSYTFTNVESDHTISASFSIISYSITATAGAGGSISPSGVSSVDHGNGLAYTITPNAGYAISDVVVDGISVGAVSSYSFTNVQANHSISVSFVSLSYTITASSVGGGTINPPGVSSVNHGQSITYSIQPFASFDIINVTVDGISVGPVTSYTFNNVTTNHTIFVEFGVIYDFSISATAGPGGTMAPLGLWFADYGDDVTYNITPNPGFQIADVLVDGVSVGAVNSYSFIDLTASHTIHATFSPVTFQIAATAGVGGSISPNGSTSVAYNGSQSFIVSAEAGYAISDVLVDGISIGAVGSYTFSNVLTDHTIEAVFEEVITNVYSITATFGAGGSVSPAGLTSVSEGGSQSYTISPNSCFAIADVTVDGVSVGVVSSYTFSNVTSNHSISATFAYMPAPSNIAGIKNVCQFEGTGGLLTYSFAPIPGATSYTWTIPTTTTLISGQGTNEIQITINNGFTAGANKQLRVRANYPCGMSAIAVFYLASQLPVTPVAINGPSNICSYLGSATTASYTTDSVPGASEYIWTVPAGMTIASGQGTRSIEVIVTNSYTVGNIEVRTQNSCGVSNPRTLIIKRPVPVAPSIIEGPRNVCMFMPTSQNPSGTQVQYSVVNQAGTVFSWIVPAGAQILSGQGTHTIDVSFNGSFSGGSISVTASNSCGESAARTLSLSTLTPLAPGAIDVVNMETCPDRVYQYSVSGMPANATYLQWSVPVGGTITSGQGSSTITVSYGPGAISGSVTVHSGNGCGISATRTAAVKMPACPNLLTRGAEPEKSGDLLPDTGLNAELQVFPNPSTSYFSLNVKGAKGNQPLQIRVIDKTGRVLESRSFYSLSTVRFGETLRPGTYILEISQGNSRQIRQLVKL